ncbi:MAG TPA: hypothetical protein VJK51_03150 [Candidatus Nanoarchaeia archaeon]|nr:hypothetical protein [Candidatus Nanoarchaeia archaeon]
MINFRKIASVVSSALMLSSTVALAAAANYPAPFVKGGMADVAVVYGANLPAGSTDLVAVADIQGNLATHLAKQTSSSGSSGKVSTSGETAALFEGSSKVYANDTLNAVKSVLTKTNLPTVLADGSLSGNVDATFTQTLTIGSHPQLTYAKQPTSSDDPGYALAVGTNAQTQGIYNATITFNKAVNFSHADTKGADFTMFGQKFTVSASTDGTNLVLLKTAEKVSLTSDAPTATVTIGGKEYTIELVSASDTSATIKVTDSAGGTETKEVSENNSKKIQGVTVAVTNADETNLKLSASVIAGAEKVTLTDGSSVTTGEDNKVIDGTYVSFVNSASTGNLTQVRVSVAAPNSDNDAVKQGGVFVDPVFGSFKLDFSAGLNIWSNSSSREEIKFSSSSDDKNQVTFTNAEGKTATQIWARNLTARTFLHGDNDGHNITVFERALAYRNDFIVVGNENTGKLIKVYSIVNQTTGYADDKVRFTDVFSGDTYEASLTAEGSGSVVIGGKSYTVTYVGANSISEDARSVRLNYPDSSAAGSAVLYPTVQTSKGAKLAFYTPINITLSDWDGAGSSLTQLRFPDGDGYTDVTVGYSTLNTWNFTVGSTVYTLNLTLGNSVGLPIGRLVYNVSGNVTGGALGASGAGSGGNTNQTYFYLNDPSAGTVIGDPAVVIFEEKDDNSNYEALVVTLEPGTSSSDALDINSVDRTWGPNGADSGWSDSLASDSDITRKADLFGSIISIDNNNAGHQSATISYPDEQVYAQLYMSKNDATVSSDAAESSGDGSVKELGSVVVTDSEVSSVAGKNLIVVGGSCVNSVAAGILGGSLCGADFEAKTSVGNSMYLIETFGRDGKVATLVAGYNAGDTINAAKFLTTQTVDTTVGKKYKGTTATSAELVVA